MKKLNTAQILQELAKLREQLPPEMKRELPPKKDSMRMKLPKSGDAMADFETAALMEAIESMADGIAAGVAEKQKKLLEQALEIYYTAEELAKNPENANLIPHLEEMRRAYMNQYGKPIPPRKK